MTRLRTVSTNDTGWTRRRAGRGFVYLDEHGGRLSDVDVERIKSLVIPPAWAEVWICPVANGHIQAVGTDAAGRRQYLYHPGWRKLRDEAKFDRVLEMARKLPKARSHILSDLDAGRSSKQQALAVTARLIDLGLFRIGSDEYTDEHGSYGLTTLERHHVRTNGSGLVFSFLGKSGIEHEIELYDAPVCAAVQQMRRRRSGGDRLLAYKDGRRWRSVDADDVNVYLREVFGRDVTSKDFRTWHATVIAAAVLADADTVAATKTARRKAVRQAAVEVSESLGNTPAIARNSYIDPLVVDLYEDGTTIAPALRRAPKNAERRQHHLERAVVRMLSRAPESARRSRR